MGQPIDIVGQMGMDSYYQNYRSDSDFFSLEDFIYHTGATVADAYQKEYQRQYAEYRQEGRDELVSFDPSWLNEQTLEVKNKDGELSAELETPAMTFLYDKCTAGIQFVFSVRPTPGIELERLGLAEKWQIQYQPFSNKIYFTPQKNRITITKTGNCNVTKIKVLYIPEINDKMIIPDGLVDTTITNTVQKMRAYKDGTVVKKSVDLNPNAVLQTEVNPMIK